MPNPTVEITQTGSGGGITYREDNHTVDFSWKFALPPALARIFGPASKDWDPKFPWAAGRQAEIFDFVGEEVIRQKADGYEFKVDLDTGRITITQWTSRRLHATPRSEERGSYPPAGRSPAYEKFLASVVPHADQWKEDQTYDVAAIEEMTAAERDEVVALLTEHDVTWREVVALAAIDTPQAQAALEAATKHQDSIDTRLAAADCLSRQGRFADFETFLAGQIRLLNRPEDGLKRALLLAERHPSDPIKQALLWASYNPTDCAPHCAKLLLAFSAAAVELLTARDVTWQEVVGLAAINTPQAHAALEAASKHQVSIETRLAAADCLSRQGRFADLETFLARQIRLLNRPADGLKRALLLAESHPSETIKQALLWASYNSTECAPHCAKLLLALTGAAKEPFAADVEQMLAKLGLHSSYFDRRAAFDELCQRVKMELDTRAGD